jgi:predicted phosphodiesterase
MTKEELKEVLRTSKGYLKSGAPKLSVLFNISIKAAKAAVREVNIELGKISVPTAEKVSERDLFAEFLEWKKSNHPFKAEVVEKLPEPFATGDPDNVLVIGDLHEPFCLNEYLYFCREIQEKDNCGTVVFIGDVIDNHYSSYHESEAQTFGPNEEFLQAKKRLQRWYKVFPTAFVTIGNHDRMVHRKAKSAGIAEQWVVDYSTALETPGWKFVHEVVIKGVNYNHGEGGTARTRMKTEMQSQVQGHLHSQFYIDYNVGSKHKIFGVQVGCGIDRNSFAFAYGKNGPKPVIGCATVLNGVLPCLYPMNL